MGTGKTAVGRHAADISGREFIDIDAEIVAKHGDISSIFEEAGEDAFRMMEQAVVADIAPRRNLVIATGGGTMLDPDNVVAMLGADIFTLTADADTILERVSADGLDSRPLLTGAANPAERISELLADRADAYNKFTQIDTTGKSIEQIVRDLKAAGADLTAPDTGATGAEARERVLWAVAAIFLAIVVVLFVLVMTF